MIEDELLVDVINMDEEFISVFREAATSTAVVAEEMSTSIL